MGDFSLPFIFGIHKMVHLLQGFKRFFVAAETRSNILFWCTNNEKEMVMNVELGFFFWSSVVLFCWCRENQGRI